MHNRNPARLMHTERWPIHPTSGAWSMSSEKVQAKLKEMEETEQIIKVTKPTEWVNSMVVV